MTSRAFQTIIAANKSKYGMKFPSRFAQWNDIDILIVDEPPTSDLKINLARQGVTVRIASR